MYARRSPRCASLRCLHIYTAAPVAYSPRETVFREARAHPGPNFQPGLNLHPPGMTASGPAGKQRFHGYPRTWNLSTTLDLPLEPLEPGAVLPSVNVLLLFIGTNQRQV